MKKRMIQAVSLVLALLVLVGCAFAEDAATEAEATGRDLTRLRLGSSVYTVMIDDDFIAEELTEAEIAAGEIGHYKNDETGLELEVFQQSKDGLTKELSHFTLEQANAEERVEVVWPSDTVNDIGMGWYWGTKTRDGEARDIAAYILDSGDTYVELLFWPSNEKASMEVLDIVESLQYMSLKQISLGTSGLTLVVPDDYMQGQISDEDIADDQVAYWYSDASLLDFDVYQFSKESVSGQTLAEYVVEESSTYPAVSELVTDGEINTIPAAWYRAVDECDEGEYDTITYIFEKNDEYVEVVFWLDGPTAMDEADYIIHNLIDESQSGQ